MGEIKRITVKASAQYEVVVGSGILEKFSKFLPADLYNIGSKKIAVITDDIVQPLYENEVRNAFLNTGAEVVTFVFPNGEISKNINTLSEILEFLAENKLTRSDLIVALGGGVVGDITGFAAGIYLRGIDYIQIPTTFLAAVDSSVGGKTAVDLNCGKNLAGIFYQPRLVLCDTDVFKTLSDDTFTDGLSEAIKYGVIYDEKLFKSLAGKRRNEITDEIIPVVARCVEIKAEIVGEDEFDTGKRQLLNFGHTIGHGIEKCSNFKITHGKAVSIGMAVMAGASEQLGWSDAVRERICGALFAASLPIKTDFPAEEIYKAALSDKKRKGEKMTVVAVEKIGKCVLKEINVSELAEIIKAGLRK